VDLVASFFTLSGGGFTDPPRVHADRLGLLVALEAFAWAAIADLGIATELIRRAKPIHPSCARSPSAKRPSAPPTPRPGP
jgi:hypothetical protein